MQTPNWNDLRYVLAIGRKDRLGGAAKLLGVDDPTVARCLSALEAANGQRLHQRLASGQRGATPPPA